MSSNWVKDINDMHNHYGFHDKIGTVSKESLSKYLKFRLDFIKEELIEGYQAQEDKDPEEVVDALIDMCVVAIGTLDLYGVDANKAWDEVLRANMSKEVGIKETRADNPVGIDLTKPEGWTAPDHAGNHGTFTDVLND